MRADERQNVMRDRGLIPLIQGPFYGETDRERRYRCAHNHDLWADAYDAIGETAAAQRCRYLAEGLRDPVGRRD